MSHLSHFKVHCSVALSTFTLFCNYRHCLFPERFEHFHYLQAEVFYPFRNNPQPSSPSLKSFFPTVCPYVAYFRHLASRTRPCLFFGLTFSLSVTFLRFTRVVACVWTTLFHGWGIFQCVSILRFGCAFPCWWTLGSLPPWATWIMLLWTLAYRYLFESLLSFRKYENKEGLAGKRSHSVFNFSEQMPDCTTVVHTLHHFAFPPTVHQGSNISTSSRTLVILLYFFSW